MSPQIAVDAPATRVASRKLGPVAGSLSRSSLSARAAWATSTLASTCGRWETAAISRSWVVGVERLRPRAELDEQAVQALVEDAGRPRRRRQVPRRAVEQLGAGVLDARRLGAGERMAADEARVGDGGDDRPLGRADVGHDAARAGVRQRLAHGARQRADRRGDERGVRAVQRLRRRRARGVEHTARERRLEHAGCGVEAPHLGARPGRGRRARPSRRSARRRGRRSSSRAPGRAVTRSLRAPCRRPRPRPRPSPRTARSRRRAAPAARRRWPPRGAGAPRR